MLANTGNNSKHSNSNDSNNGRYWQRMAIVATIANTGKSWQYIAIMANTGNNGHTSNNGTYWQQWQ